MLHDAGECRINHPSQQRYVYIAFLSIATLRWKAHRMRCDSIDTDQLIIPIVSLVSIIPLSSVVATLVSDEWVYNLLAGPFESHSWDEYLHIIWMCCSSHFVFLISLSGPTGSICSLSSSHWSHSVSRWEASWADLWVLRWLIASVQRLQLDSQPTG